MNKLDTSKLKHGLYRLHWREGGSSIASVGSLHDGTRGFAPANWTSSSDAGIACVKWSKVARVDLLMEVDYEEAHRISLSPDHPAPQPPRGVETSAAIHGASVEVPTTAVDAEAVAPDEPAPGQGRARDGRAVCPDCDRPVMSSPMHHKAPDGECAWGSRYRVEDDGVDCLRATIEKWRAKYEHKCAQADRASAEDVRLRAEVERLKAESAERLAMAEDFNAQRVQAGRLLAARELEVTALTNHLAAMTTARDEANTARIEAEHARDDARESRDAWKAAAVGKAGS